ncbi:MAG: hypothetical protein ACXAD7_12835 [Candidatus Kariarchaeaceae archaeon]|jgi:hypothetical protein
MAQKIALSFVFQQILKEIGPSLSKEQKEKIESQVDSKLAKTLGSDWSKLPVTGPRMMVLVIVLNVVLLPFGIAPALLADVVISKGKELEVDRKFIQLIETAKGDFSRDKLNEFSKYAESAGKTIGESLNTIISEGIEVTKGIVKRGKGFLTNLANRSKGAISKEKETN